MSCLPLVMSCLHCQEPLVAFPARKNLFLILVMLFLHFQASIGDAILHPFPPLVIMSLQFQKLWWKVFYRRERWLMYIKSWCLYNSRSYVRKLFLREKSDSIISHDVSTVPEATGGSLSRGKNPIQSPFKVPKNSPASLSMTEETPVKCEPSRSAR